MNEELRRILREINAGIMLCVIVLCRIVYLMAPAQHRVVAIIADVGFYFGMAFICYGIIREEKKE